MIVEALAGTAVGSLIPALIAFAVIYKQRAKRYPNLSGKNTCLVFLTIWAVAFATVGGVLVLLVSFMGVESIKQLARALTILGGVAGYIAGRNLAARLSNHAVALKG